MNYRRIRNILISLLLITSPASFAQEPGIPLLKQVSVIKGTGNVELSWDFSESTEIFIYIDDQNDPSLNMPVYTELDSVHNDTTNIYIDYSANADQNSRIYYIRARNSFDMGDFSLKIPTTHLTLIYDTCNNIVSLEWDNEQVSSLYDGEADVNLVYEVYRNKNNEGESRIYGPTSELSYTDTDIEDNTEYEYHIKAIPDHYSNPIKSTSNYISLSTDIYQSPDYIQAVSVNTDNTNTLVSFEIAPNTEINQYKFLRSDSYNGVFDTLETITSTNLSLIATHQNSQPETDVNYYKLVSINNCGIATTYSNVINNIVLEVENNDFINRLSWNLFKEFDMVSTTYNIFRSIDDQPAELIYSYPNFESYRDNVETFRNEFLSSKFCYYIQAFETNGNAANYSQSNTVCIYLEPEIYIPEAFTPNGDGKNDYFTPKFSFIPAKFELKIYNRWGNMIYKTNDFEQGWDGSALNNQQAPTGSYLYHIYIKLPDNQIIEKQGNVTVIYP